MSRRLFIVVVLSMLVLSLGATYAFAEGYNNPLQYTRATGYFSGPHGGYATTTNKCADCHSTHYASGSYMLLRASSREAACDFCHGGGGGSSTIVQMDNEYGASSAAATTTMGFGTGHSLGYKGKAPSDIEPAFSESKGLACFNCHTPHGNSARVLEAFGSPSHPAGEGKVRQVVGVSFMAAQMYRMQESMGIVFDFGDFNAWTSKSYPQNSYMPIPDDLSQLQHDLDGTPVVKWSGAETEIGAVIRTSDSLAGAVDMTEETGEVHDALVAFGAWQAAGGPKPPTAAQLKTWAETAGNLGAQVNGKYTVTNQGVGTLFALFGVSFDGDGNVTDPGKVVPLFMNWKVYWGEDVDAGNIATAFLNMGDFQVNGASYSPVANPELEVWHKPLFGKGRFLLVKNPDKGDDYTTAEGGVNDMGKAAPDFKQAGAGQEANDANGKKVAIDWDWPLGPAASWGPYFNTGSDERFPLAFPWAPKGVAMENEFCSSCHDGAAGLSTQAAKVWKPDTIDSSTGAYTQGYGHDSNMRGCARAQYLNPGDDLNFGPHCANCHTGGSGCQTCHSAQGDNWTSFGRDAYDPLSATKKSYTETSTIFVEGESSYKAPDSLRASAVINVGGQCIDGGFTYPHRTLGANMLKDALYGVDFDGDPIAPGETRMSQGSVEALYGAAYFKDFFTVGASIEATPASFNATTLAGAKAQNLDSVCIDCHGDGSYWNGDDPKYKADFWSGDPLTGTPYHIEGWNLLLKGLP